MFGRKVQVDSRFGEKDIFEIKEMTTVYDALFDCEGQFVRLNSTTRPGVHMNLHINHVQKILSTGRDGSGIVLLNETNEPVQMTTPVVQEQKVERKQVVRTAVVGGSKKEQARVIVNRMVGEGKTRKEIIQVLKADLLMSDAGAATYYYNISKGIW